ncbi:YceD family protein [Paenibacillus sp. GCM10027628]|uniref:YceD family protein n=1 Tax=Paenibacillus sp. GCM10027628 TaxID=3273413 RepID=UPI003640DEB8
MQIHLKDLALKGQPVHITEDLNLTAPFVGRQDILGYSPIHVDLHARHEGGAAKVNGTLTLDLELSCSRCLSHVKQTIELPFEEVFTQKLDEESEDNEDIHLVTEDKVDLEPYVSENVVVGLPYIPLCDEACKGLCPVCGENRNLRDCGCKQEKIDPRLAGLADFFNKE